MQRSQIQRRNSANIPQVSRPSGLRPRALSGLLALIAALMISPGGRVCGTENQAGSPPPASTSSLTTGQTTTATSPAQAASNQPSSAPTAPPAAAAAATAATAAPESVAAPPGPPLPLFRNSHPRRSVHINRSWQLIGGVGVHTVHINQRARQVRVMVGFAAGADPRRGYFPRENFCHIVQRYQPRVAINGTYFHLLNGHPTGSIVRYGQFLYDGRWGTTVALNRDGEVTVHYKSGTYGRHLKWDDVEHALTTGPTLVRDGQLWLNPGAEGFRDPGVLGTARRSALGLTRDNRLVLVVVTTPISLNKLAHIMLRLNCQAAVNLDGGSSSALYCNGQYLTMPQRRLSNVLLVYD
jgi:hypothetical protein